MVDFPSGIPLPTTAFSGEVGPVSRATPMSDGTTRHRQMMTATPSTMSAAWELDSADLLTVLEFFRSAGASPIVMTVGAPWGNTTATVYLVSRSVSVVPRGDGWTVSARFVSLDVGAAP